MNLIKVYILQKFTKNLLRFSCIARKHLSEIIEPEGLKGYPLELVETATRAEGGASTSIYLHQY